MPYQIYAKNLDLTEPLKEYINMKIEKLSRFLKNSDDYCQVDLSRDAHHKKGQVFRAEINLTVNGKTVRVAETSIDIRGAIDFARDKVFLQLNKTKEKIISRRQQVKNNN